MPGEHHRSIAPSGDRRASLPRYGRPSPRACTASAVSLQFAALAAFPLPSPAVNQIARKSANCSPQDKSSRSSRNTAVLFAPVAARIPRRLGQRSRAAAKTG
ncbi:hypothetical protein BS50DRAFT_568307 [Corynespora cassiicola Philippines]|uniref:Uncharacterized protein n=1 Tax=Corynespora cassiicola Philippines TaxID=1448308 RepID=A0A2T2P4W4_CORCC|nr:hypothetical protein BS50DRAFT_568307 [Corynespora cassiicola Philippines]